MDKLKYITCDFCKEKIDANDKAMYEHLLCDHPDLLCDQPDVLIFANEDETTNKEK